MEANKEGNSIAKAPKKEEVLEFFNTRSEKNIEIPKADYDRLVSENYPLEHLTKKREA